MPTIAEKTKKAPKSAKKNKVDKAKKSKSKAGKKTSLIEMLGRPKHSPLFWSVPKPNRSQAKRSLPQAIIIERLYREKKPNDWRELVSSVLNRPAAAASGDLHTVDLLGVLAVVHFVSAHPVTISELEKSGLLETLHKQIDSYEFDLQFDPLLFQLAHVELPLSASIGLRDPMPNANDPIPNDWLESGLANLHECIAELLDGNGWPEGRVLKDFGLLAASWTRCHRLLQNESIDLGVEAIEQLEWMVRQFMRLLRHDGSLMLSDFGSGISHKPFGEMLLELSDDKFDRKLSKTCFPKSKPPKKLATDFPEEFDLSEWAQVAATRSSWSRKCSRLAVDFHDQRIRMEIANSKTLILGDCTPDISINGKPLSCDDVIEAVCTDREIDLDYLELDMTYGDVTVQRQIVFNRTDQFLFLADVVKPTEAARIDYQCQFPLGPAVESMAESETTEYYLKSDKFQSLILPLSLPEWKSERTDDRFTVKDNKFELTQSIVGKGLCAALFIDLSPKRCLKPRTWRRLTVAEKLQIVGQDEAVAFRVQVDKQQWLFYRAIGDAQNRTFLGENFASEFFVGAMDRDGEVTSLMEVEREDWD